VNNPLISKRYWSTRSQKITKQNQAHIPPSQNRIKHALQHWDIEETLAFLAKWRRRPGNEGAMRIVVILTDFYKKITTEIQAE